MLRPALALIAVPVALAFGLAALAQTPAAAPPSPASTSPGAAAALAPGPEHDLVARVCSGCHSAGVIAAQRMSPVAWKETLETMASNGAVASDAELDQILAYVTRNYGDKPAPAPAPDKPGR